MQACVCGGGVCWGTPLIHACGTVDAHQLCCCAMTQACILALHQHTNASTNDLRPMQVFFFLMLLFPRPFLFPQICLLQPPLLLLLLLWYAVRYCCGMTYVTVTVYATVLLLYAGRYCYGMRYGTVVVYGTVLLLYAVRYCYGMRYGIVTVCGTVLLRYAVQYWYSVWYCCGIWYCTVLCDTLCCIIHPPPTHTSPHAGAS